MNLDPAFLRAALLGYEAELARIDQAMAELRRQLDHFSKAGTAATPGRRRGMSAAARRRIAAAQRKRWAAYRKAKRGKGKE